MMTVDEIWTLKIKLFTVTHTLYTKKLAKSWQDVDTF